MGTSSKAEHSQSAGHIHRLVTKRQRGIRFKDVEENKYCNPCSDYLSCMKAELSKLP